MAWKARVHFPGALRHVISRGNQRQEIFLDDRNRTAYLSYLSEKENTELPKPDPTRTGNWPDRVKEKFKTNKSFAIAHGLEELYEEKASTPKKGRRRTK